MKNRWLIVLNIAVMLALTLGACAPAATQTPAQPAETEAPAATAAPAETKAPEPTKPPEPTATEAPTAVPTEPPAPTEIPFDAPKGALVSVKAAEVPALDGAADDAAWADAPELKIEVTGGVNESDTEVTLKSVYDGETVYYVMTWADPTESWLRAPWEKQEDGSWKKLADPDDKGGDNNLYYEDKIAFIWSIANSIQGFETAGCGVTCHVGENSDVKPYGNKYTAEEGELGDIWHWKSVRNVGQIDDQYLDWTRFDAENAKEAGRKSDAKDSGGYVDNQTEDKKLPAFMPADGGSKDGAPGYLLDSEKVPFDDSLFQPGDRLPAIIKSEIVGDRGDIKAAWKWADGQWTLEFARKLVTGSETDVQFDDLAAVYHFGLAIFDNAQVRHAFQAGVTPFVFKP